MTVFAYIRLVKFQVFDVLSSVNNLEQLELAKSHNNILLNLNAPKIFSSTTRYKFKWLEKQDL